MRIPCRKCNAEMQYPFRICRKCGWKPEGKFLEKAEVFARNYEREHGIEPKRTEKNPKGYGPGLVKPPPGKDAAEMERVLDPEVIACPQCGETIRISSPKRPIKVSCKECGAKIRVLDPNASEKTKKKSSTHIPENIECPKCGETISISRFKRNKASCPECGVKIRIMD